MRRDLERWWASAEFQRDLAEWITSELAAQGASVIGPPVAHRLRFWSAVFRVPTDAGTVWAKACNPGQRFEPPLTEALAELVPDHVLAPIATCTDAASGRFWVLLPDGGTTLREHGGATPAHWLHHAEVWRRLLAEVTPVPDPPLIGAVLEAALRPAPSRQ